MGKRKRPSKVAGPSSPPRKSSEKSQKPLNADLLATDNPEKKELNANEDGMDGNNENEEQADESTEKENEEDDYNHNEVEGDENDELEDNSETLPKSTTASKVIDLNEIKKFGQKVDRTGLVYVSRIPPGMGPSKLKHLLSKWGAIGRIYLARDEKAEESKRKFNKKGKIRKKLKDKHQSFLFKEGWVEFMDKKVARRAAEMLNTRPIGGKPSDRYYSDLWTLTYLPKFKWTNLSDQIAIERRIKEQLVRNSLEESKISQDWYLGMVEKNATNQKILAKKLKRNPELSTAAKAGKPLDFKQRELPTAPNQQGSKLKSVLDGLF
ncbi:hypothetical protein PtA15_7A102 [Puccinia triticina]|uniref:18S rRNA factor 2 n=1 Tax=Puccinia triticina TaxID=208348 RepID=A0ABY7CMB6_9BASI|nr:uncharacterized protein PtA15_7A102 [Puccinia triticina]WAQ86376.1 hypothetical protein PtA15_7A102 [Puccinia triticina]